MKKSVCEKEERRAGVQVQGAKSHDDKSSEQIRAKGDDLTDRCNK